MGVGGTRSLYFGWKTGEIQFKGEIHFHSRCLWSHEQEEKNPRKCLRQFFKQCKDSFIGELLRGLILTSSKFNTNHTKISATREKKNQTMI